MRPTRILSASLQCAILLSVACRQAPERPGHAGHDIYLPPETEVIEARVPANSTLESILQDHLGSRDLVSSVITAASRAFDLRRLRANNPYRLELTLDGSLRLFEYHIDSDRFLRVVGLNDRQPPTLEVEVVPYTKERALVALQGTIDADHSSLVAALDAVGENVQLAIELADILGGEIDFNSDLQVGDTFEIVFEKLLRRGEFDGYGQVLGAEFVNEGRRVRAFRFAVPGQKPGYYDEQGRSLRRMFLRSPLPFQPRVVSGFSLRRLHPVHRIYRAHLGVDYRAPYGTPVVAVASGIVLSAGFSGEAGRMVRLRHTSGYETYYLHLSSFAKGIRAGARVAQGDVIGRVGNSGTVSGTHLDYRIKKNGSFVNPLRVQRDMPPGDPVPAIALAAFESQRDQTLGQFVGPLLVARDRTHQASTGGSHQ